MAFKVDIINIENNVNNILLTDDLTIELLKVRYNWILNATIKNVVLGLDDYGLVWYMGEWICGEWEDGTWYSGIWHDGIWKKGRWYSYLLDKPMILSKRFVIIENDKKYSQFLNGKWYNGDWHNGTFGNDNIVSGLTNFVTDETINCPYWYNGNWYNGLFKNSVWKKGIFFNGNFINSYWVDGKFYNGIFDNYEWWNGVFLGGDFVKGKWKNGSFNQINTNILSRFGTSTGTTIDGTLTTWENGSFEKGEFMSGLYFDSSGNTIASQFHNTTHWKNGLFNNGIWWGGHFEMGSFNYGNWYGGVFNTNVDDSYTPLTIWKNGAWYDGVWLNGIFKSGLFLGGMWMNGIFENGFLVSLFTGIMTDSMKLNTIPSSLPPPPPNYTIPVVETTNVILGTVPYNSIIAYGNVISDGGLITNRGICYSTTNPPTINDFVTTDIGIGTGIYSCDIMGLLQNTTYFVRAWATNIPLGTGYGVTKEIITGISTLTPVISTVSATVVPYGATLYGEVISSDSTVIEMGFRYSTDSSIPYLSPKVTHPTPAIGTYSIDILNVLTYETTYWYQSYAINSSGSGYGEIKKFTSGSDPA